MESLKSMEYEEIKLLKQSDKSTVYLVREKGGERIFIRKVLTGQHPVYQTLLNAPHPCLPKIHEVIVEEDTTTVIEEYIEGLSCSEAELSEKEFRQFVRELCSVLEFLHGKGIIHRDIKPSNIIWIDSGHVCLIDFDAARMFRERKEQDTKLLGTRGYAPPEQYGFAQTDERADIYALGMTLEQLVEEKNWKKRYRRILHKCTNLDPDKRYQTVRQFRRAFSRTDRRLLCGAAAIVLLALAGICVWGLPALQKEIGTESLAGGGRTYRSSCAGESSLGWRDRHCGVG